MERKSYAGRRMESLDDDTDMLKDNPFEEEKKETIVTREDK